MIYFLIALLPPFFPILSQQQLQILLVVDSPNFEFFLGQS